MFYKKRKMAAENKQRDDQKMCLVHRLVEIPLVNFSLEQLTSFYAKTKQYNRLVGGTLQLAENSVKFAYDKTEPFRKILDAPIVFGNKIACQQLEKLEDRFPIILTTPDQVVKVGKDYYEKSYIIKFGVDKALAVKEYGETKVQNTKKLANDVISGIVYVGHLKVSDVLRFGVLTIDRVLTVGDHFIDSYIAPPAGEINGVVNTTEEDKSSYIGRVYRMSTKVVNGVKYRVGYSYDFTKEHVMNILQQMNAIFPLLDFAKNTVGWSNEETIAKVAAAQQQLASLITDILDRGKKYGKHPDVALLNFVQTVTLTFANVSDHVLKLTAPYLPDNIEKNVVLVVDYAHDLSQNFNRATSLGELKTEVLKEAKDKFLLAQQILLTVLDRVTVYPPISWLGINKYIARYVEDTTETNNAHFLPNGEILEKSTVNNSSPPKKSVKNKEDGKNSSPAVSPAAKKDQ